MENETTTPPKWAVTGCFGYVAGLCFLCAMVFLLEAPSSAYQDWRYGREGATTADVQVVRKFKQEGSGESGTSINNVLQIEYTDERGAKWQADDHVALETWERVQPGDPYRPIEYLRSNPFIHRFPRKSGAWPFGSLVGGGFLLVALLLSRLAAWISAENRRRAEWISTSESFERGNLGIGFLRDFRSDSHGGQRQEDQE